MVSRADIVAEARTWLGTRYRHQAALKGVACDCIGLVGGVALACGVAGAMEWASDPSLHNYGRQPDPVILIDACDRFMQRVAIGGAIAGDVLVLRFERDPQHFALLTVDRPPYIIHAHAMARRVVEARLDDVWRSRVLRAYRFRGVDG